MAEQCRAGWEENTEQVRAMAARRGSRSYVQRHLLLPSPAATERRSRRLGGRPGNLGCWGDRFPLRYSGRSTFFSLNDGVVGNLYLQNNGLDNTKPSNTMAHLIQTREEIVCGYPAFMTVFHALEHALKCWLPSSLPKRSYEISSLRIKQGPKRGANCNSRLVPALQINTRRQHDAANTKLQKVRIPQSDALW